jgi:3-oxoacyl-[acyl-carrier protein] reductase
MSIFNLENKRVLITGASRGLGSICARELAENGAQLVLLARSEEKLEEVRRSCKDNEVHLSVPVDLVETENIHNVIKRAEEHLGKIDVVLHVVGGGLGLRDPLLHPDELIKLFRFNVGIAAEINRIVIPGMMERKTGNLVHVASIASSEATASVGYNTVKAGLAAYVRTLGNELAGSGVVATGILPGAFYAPENSWERHKLNNPEMVKQFIENRLPRGFIGKAEELIPLIFFLCSDAASMMGGCLVPIDAGEGKAYVVHE